MPRLALALVLVVTGGMLAACGGNNQPQIVVFVPSATVTASPTLTPTPGVMERPATLTPMPTRSPTTPTPGPSPTNPLAPTFTAAPVTLTATRVPTVAGIAIEYFTTDSEYVRPGANLTLFWSVRGVRYAQIYRVDAQGERIWRWDVNAQGKLTVSTRREDRDVARFVLEAEAGGTRVEQPLLIPLQCPEVWFFDPAPDACPSAPAQLSTQAEQTFERGRMIWVAALDRVYVVFEDGRTPGWAQYPDDFDEGEPESDPALSPPPGLLQPVRGFGLVWRENARVRDRLGWATSPEVAFEGMYQFDSIEPSVATSYVRMRDGGILALDANTNTWRVLPPTGTP